MGKIKRFIIADIIPMVMAIVISYGVLSGANYCLGLIFSDPPVANVEVIIQPEDITDNLLQKKLIDCQFSDVIIVDTGSMGFALGNEGMLGYLNYHRDENILVLATALDVELDERAFEIVNDWNRRHALSKVFINGKQTTLCMVMDLDVSKGVSLNQLNAYCQHFYNSLELFFDDFVGDEGA